MRYMMFIKHTEDYRNVKVPAALYEAMGKFIEDSIKKGQFVTGGGLQPMAAGAQVRLKGGKILVTDGPFVETKEVVGGYAVIEAKTREEALEHAQEFMALHRTHWPEFEGLCEVRPMEEEVKPA